MPANTATSGCASLQVTNVAQTIHPQNTLARILMLRICVGTLITPYWDVRGLPTVFLILY